MNNQQAALLTANIYIGASFCTNTTFGFISCLGFAAFHIWLYSNNREAAQ